MFKFNSETLLTGQIKQKLADFNLPRYRVYTKEQEAYANLNNGKETDIVPTLYTNEYPSYANKAEVLYETQILYAPYIKDNIIQEYIKLGENNYEWRPHHFNLPNHDKVHKYNDSTSSNVEPYLYGVKKLNYTKTLQIKNNIYDSYTHEYLGDYLRFQRDYNGINLMSLYNCYSNRTADDLEFKFTTINGTLTEFNTKNTGYKILMIPVKLFKQYTIALQCESVVEVCCGMYSVYQDKRAKFVALPGMTYEFYNNIQFISPVLFDKLSYDYLLAEGGEQLISNIAQNEDNLKLFIKIPSSAKTSIVVLEGDYRGFNQSHLSINNSKLTRVTNHTLVTYENVSKLAPEDLISPLQLLQMNTGESYPFSDRLIEYLVDNMVLPTDEIPDNIKRIKTVVGLNIESDAELAGKLSANETWSAILTPLLYNQMVNEHNTFELNRDILGYCDKATEKYYKFHSKNANETVTISNVDIYESEDNVHEWQ